MFGKAVTTCSSCAQNAFKKQWRSVVLAIKDRAWFCSKFCRKWYESKVTKAIGWHPMTVPWRRNSSKDLIVIYQLPSPTLWALAQINAYTQEQLKGSKYLSIHSICVSVHNGIEGEEGGVQGFLSGWQGERRGRYSLVVRQSAVIQMPLFQMVTEALSVDQFPSLDIFLIHISTSFILFPLCLFPINFSLLPYNFFSQFSFFFFFPERDPAFPSQIFIV